MKKTSQSVCLLIEAEYSPAAAITERSFAETIKSKLNSLLQVSKVKVMPRASTYFFGYKKDGDYASMNPDNLNVVISMFYKNKEYSACLQTEAKNIICLDNPDKINDDFVKFSKDQSKSIEQIVCLGLKKALLKSKGGK